jgi:histidine ammonia-lyase
MGNRVSEEVCRLILLLKIKNFTKGVSGVRIELVDFLIEMYNRGIIPVIYEMGSLGASGDLAPLAHLSLVVLGKGEVYFKGKLRRTEDVLSECMLTPLKLKAKEGLALLNGTQFSLSFTTLCTGTGIKIFNLWNKIAALSLQAYCCDTAPFNALIHEIRPHPGQILAAKQIRKLLEGSSIESKSYSVQDPYSFRCIPQVHGATWQALDHVRQVLEIEMNAATDNPNVFDIQGEILSGGNFHAQSLAIALDYLAIAIAELGNISERRVYQLINGDRGLPAFLTGKPGLNSGFMIAQYTAASIVSQNKQYCSPSSVDSIPSSKGQEDHVSMAANAGTKCLKVIENLKMLIAIEMLVAAQALDFRVPEIASPDIFELYQRIRTRIPFLNEDRLMHSDLSCAQELIEDLLHETDLNI